MNDVKTSALARKMAELDGMGVTAKDGEYIYFPIAELALKALDKIQQEESNNGQGNENCRDTRSDDQGCR